MACSARSSSVLRNEARDLPFSLCYLFEEDGKSARRVSLTGFDRSAARSSAAVFARSARILAASGVARARRRRSWSSSTRRVIGLRAPGRARRAAPSSCRSLVPAKADPAGVFIAGLNPHRPLDDSLRSFVDLFVGQLAAGLANAGAYEAAQKRADALAQIDRAKTAFFSNVSHEFRTPLTLMLGPTEDALSSPERALTGANLETVHRNELRLLKLVNGLLDFARIEAGRARASFQPTDLRALTVDLASTFRSAIERAGLVLRGGVRSAARVDLHRPRYVGEDRAESAVERAEIHVHRRHRGQPAVARWAGPVQRARHRRGRGGAASSPDSSSASTASKARARGPTKARASAWPSSTSWFACMAARSKSKANWIAARRFSISLPAGKAHLPEDSIGDTGRPTPTSAYTAYVEEALRWVPSSSSGRRVESKRRDSRRRTHLGRGRQRRHA